MKLPVLVCLLVIMAGCANASDKNKNSDSSYLEKTKKMGHQYLKNRLKENKETIVSGIETVCSRLHLIERLYAGTFTGEDLASEIIGTSYVLRILAAAHPPFKEYMVEKSQIVIDATKGQSKYIGEKLKNIVMAELSETDDGHEV